MEEDSEEAPSAIKAHINNLARAILAENLATLMLVAHEQQKLSQFSDELGLMRTLVGPSGMEKFVELSQRLTEQLMPIEDEFLAFQLNESLTSIREAIAAQDADQFWLDGVFAPAQKSDYITDEELWGWVKNNMEHRDFTQLLTQKIEQRGLEKTVNDLQFDGSEQEFLLKSARLDFTLSELRLLLLVLELETKYDVIPIELPEVLPFEIPEVKPNA